MSLTSLPNQPRPEVSEGAQASQRTIEISQNAFFSEQDLSQALESGDVLSALYRRTVTSQHDGDPKVATKLPDEEQEATNLTDDVYEGVEATSFPFYAPCFVAGMARAADVFLLKATVNNQTFSSFGEKRNVYLGVVFGEETVNGFV